MSKATARLDLVTAECYKQENKGKFGIMKTASGRYCVVDKATGKIQKGPTYAKFNLDGIF